jgi:hypothetical protein
MRTNQSSTSSTSFSSSQSSVRSDVSLLLLDVQDTITLLETELQHGQPQGESSHSLDQTLFNTTQTIDKFAKFLKSNQSNESQGDPPCPSLLTSACPLLACLS